jgi:hypothetical protein
MNIPNKAHFTKDNFGGPLIYHSGRADTLLLLEVSKYAEQILLAFKGMS